MSQNRLQRLGDLLLEFLARLVMSGLDDPRVRGVTLTGIRVRRDLKHATVYFTVRRQDSSSAEALSGLRQATGFMRMKIGRELKLRFVPTLDWEFDETPDRAQRIDELLKNSD